MDLIRQEPWSVLPQLQGEINRLLTNWNDDSSSATAGWVPPVDINEYQDRFELFVDLPGVDPKDVNLTLDNGVLTLSGERASLGTAGKPVGDEGDNLRQHRVERGHGYFHRRFILPDTVDADNVQATGRNGVLEISIPKQAKAQPRRIEVAA